MSWNLVTKEEIIYINQKVMAEEGKTSTIFNENVLDDLDAGSSLDFAPGLAEAIYVVANALAQGHPFEDGNKRTATKAVKKFIKRNGYIPTAEQMEKIAELIGELVAAEAISMDNFTNGIKAILLLEA